MSAIVQNLDIEEYYSEIKSAIFGFPDWRRLEAEAIGLPKVKFIIEKELDFSSRYIAYDFLVDLSQTFGLYLKPVGLENGCIALNILFERINDYMHRDFRYLMLTDAAYHLLFLNYKVSKIHVTGFPTRGQIDTNVPEHPTFKVNNLGRPVPY